MPSRTNSQSAARKPWAWLVAAVLCGGCARPLVVPDARESVPSAIESPAAVPVPETVSATVLGESQAETQPGPGAVPEAPRRESVDAADGDRAIAEQIVVVARRYLDKPFRGDCSGFVKRVLAEVGVELPPSGASRTASEGLYQSTRSTAQPRAGDLAFFHDTYDRNRDGKLNDPWSHVAIVESVDGDQITLIHRGGSGIARILMDLTHPSDPERNSAVRVHHRRDPPGTLYLAGELSAGFSTVVPAKAPMVRRGVGTFGDLLCWR